MSLLSVINIKKLLINHNIHTYIFINYFYVKKRNYNIFIKSLKIKHL